MDQKKTDRLDTLLTGLSPFVVAFSGGLDSSYLVYHTSRLNNIRFIAVTIRLYMPAREINEAIEFAAAHGINHKIIDVSASRKR